jgi:hypothetical protein
MASEIESAVCQKHPNVNDPQSKINGGKLSPVMDIAHENIRRVAPMTRKKNR